MATPIANAVRTIRELTARAEAAEAKLESVKRELQDADGLAEHRWQQLAEAQKRLDNAGVVGVYDEFASIPDAVYQMARHIKDLERQLAEQAGRIAELEGEVHKYETFQKEECDEIRWELAAAQGKLRELEA